MMEHYVVKIAGIKFQLKKASGMYRLVDDTRNLQVIIIYIDKLFLPSQTARKKDTVHKLQDSFRLY